MIVTCFRSTEVFEEEEFAPRKYCGLGTNFVKQMAKIKQVL